MTGERRLWDADRVLAVLLFAGFVAYLWYLPRNLGRADESHFLYEAKRIRDGEVMYRDFFQFVTPGASYAMAFLFWLFGTTIGTARMATAVLHGLTGVVMYATARALGVRPPLAVTAPLAYLALCQPAWQFASWHWFSTFFTMLVMLTMMRGPWASRPRWAIVPGLVTGVLIGIQQQKGVLIAAGVGAIFVLDHLVDRRYPRPESWRCLGVRLLCFAAGVALIVIPLLATLLWLAGFDPLFDALVRFPLVNYRSSFRTRWGAVLSITIGYADHTYPLVLKYLPVALLPACVRIVVGLYRGSDRTRLRQLIVLVVSAASAAMSIWYLPDFIHIAFVAGVFLVAAAEAIEWALTSVIRAPRPQAAIRWGVAAALTLALAAHLRWNAAELWKQFHYPHETAFGRIDFGVAWAPVLIDRTRELLSETATGELWAYPNTSEPYLTTGGRNPTPYQFFNSQVSPREHTERVLEILATRRVPYIVCQSFFLRAKDPVVQAILADYESVSIPELKGLGFRNLSLYRRKDLQRGDGGAPPS
jgi:hypothetical protein